MYLTVFMYYNITVLLFASKMNSIIIRTRRTFHVPQKLYRISVDDKQAADFAGLIKTVGNKCIHKSIVLQPIMKYFIMMLSDSIYPSYIVCKRINKKKKLF